MASVALAGVEVHAYSWYTGMPTRVGHNFREPVIVIALNPYHLDSMARIREFAYVPQETSSVLWSGGGS